jgi:hypothetical protein
MKTKTPHIHAEIIIAWAKGETVQYFDGGLWVDIKTPSWNDSSKYRIKKEWFDNIPKNGIACWVADVENDLDERIKIIVGYDPDESYPFESNDSCSWKYAIPFSNEDVKKFVYQGD